MVGIFSKVKQWYNRYNDNRIFLFCVTIPWIIYVMVLALFMLKRGYISFESNDDVFLNIISSGALGHKYSMNIYNNIIFGWMLTVLYSISYEHNWLTIVQYCIVFSGYIFLGVSNIYRNKIVKGYFTNFILLWSTVFTMICHMNYSKTGAFSIVVGLFIMGVSLESEKYETIIHRIIQIIASIYIFVGGLMRKETLYAVAPFILIYASYFFIKYKKNTIKRIIPFIIVCASLVLAWFGNEIVYRTDPDWKYFVEYNKVRTKVVDYGVPSYDEYNEEYEAIGLNRNDVVMLDNWQYADTDVFSIEKLEEIVKIRDNNREKQKFRDIVEMIGRAFVVFAGKYSIIYVFLFLFLALNIGTNSFPFRFRLLTIGLGIVEILGLLLIGRAPERAIVSAALATSILLLFYVENESSSVNKWIQIVCLGLIGGYAYFGNSYTLIEETYENINYDKTNSTAFFSYINSHEDNIYVISVGYESLFLSEYSPLDHVNKFPQANVVLSGGWPIPSPAYMDIIEEYGNKRNLFKVLAENDNVYWVVPGDFEKDPFVYYMQYHYDVYPVIVDSFGDNYNVVAFYN